MAVVPHHRHRTTLEDALRREIISKDNNNTVVVVVVVDRQWTITITGDHREATAFPRRVATIIVEMIVTMIEEGRLEVVAVVTEEVAVDTITTIGIAVLRHRGALDRHHLVVSPFVLPKKNESGLKNVGANVKRDPPSLTCSQRRNKRPQSQRQRLLPSRRLEL